MKLKALSSRSFYARLLPGSWSGRPPPPRERLRESSVAVAANANDALEVVCKKLIRSEDT